MCSPGRSIAFSGCLRRRPDGRADWRYSITPGAIIAPLFSHCRPLPAPCLKFPAHLCFCALPPGDCCGRARPARRWRRCWSGPWGRGAEAMTGIELRDVALGYGRQAVLRDVNLRLEPGAMVAVVGPNGAGKSTLVKALAGLVRPLRGRIEGLAGLQVAYMPKSVIVSRNSSIPLTLPLFLLYFPSLLYPRPLLIPSQSSRNPLFYSAPSYNPCLLNSANLHILFHLP